MPSIPDTSESAKTRNRITRKILTDAQAECLEELDRLIAEHSSPEKRLEEMECHFAKILEIIGNTLFEVSKYYLDCNADDQYDFYYWPGYVSNVSSAPRFALKTKGQSVVGVGWRCRISDHDNVATKYDGEGWAQGATQVSTWYNRILAFNPTYKLNGKPFTPAGMHDWMIHGNPAPTLTDRKVPVVVVSVGLHERSHIDQGDSYGQLTIYLDRERWQHRGEDLAHVLNYDPRIAYSIRWPCPWQDPFPRDGKLSSDDQTIQNSWEKLYNIWLAIVFDGGWAPHGREWVEAHANEFAAMGLTSLAESINDGLCDDVPEDRHTYQFWYSVRLDKAVGGIVGSPELGSAMILSSHEIYDDFFTQVKPWIEHIYFLMRHVESATLLEQSTVNHSMVQAETEIHATMAAYARGASHGLKNALAIPSLVIGNAVTDLYNFLDNYSLATRDHNMLFRCAETFSFIKDEIEYLHQQSELFFWVMDQARARQDLEHRSVDLPPCSLRMIIQRAFLRGLFLTIMSRLTRGEINHIIRNQQGSVELLEQHVSSALQTARISFAPDDLRSVMDLSKVTQEAFWSIQASIATQTDLDLSLSNMDADPDVHGMVIILLDAVLVELCQNATKAAILSAREMQHDGLSPQVAISTEVLKSSIQITIMNSAMESDCRQLVDMSDTDIPMEPMFSKSISPNGGIKGIWQIRLLCDKLSNGMIHLTPQPTIDNDERTVAFQLTLVTGKETE